MMKDVFEELWYGRLNPHEFYLHDNKEYHQQLLKVVDMQQTFLQTISKEQQNSYVEIDQESDKLRDMATYLAFRYGFQLGVLFMADSEKPFQKIKHHSKQKEFK